MSLNICQIFNSYNFHQLKQQWIIKKNTQNNYISWKLSTSIESSAINFNCAIKIVNFNIQIQATHERSYYRIP